MRDYAESNGIIINSRSNATDLAINDTVFRFMMNDSSQAVALTTLMRDEKIEYVIPVFRSDSYGEGFKEPLPGNLKHRVAMWVRA